MANKYIDVSATFNGDGTASNQAASAGAVGAWNNFVNCLKNTPGYGSIAAGDRIFVRTKNGTNLTQVEASTITMATSATVAAPVEWVFDDGTVWVSGDGIFTLSLSGVDLLFADWNHFYAGTGETRRFTLLNTHSGITQITGGQFGMAVYQNILFDVSPTSNTNTRLVYYRNRVNGIRTKLVNPYFNLYSCNTEGFFPLLLGRDNGGFYIINPTFNFNGADRQLSIFSPSPYGQTVTIIGGRILNAVTGKHFVLRNAESLTYVNIFDLHGFDLGAASILTSLTPLSDSRDNRRVTYTSRVNPFDFISYNNNGFFEWWDYQNYPTLNATLPNGRPWSVRITPSGARAGWPYQYAMTSKLYTLAPATKTITCELLIENTYTPKNNEFWVELTYVDNATGVTTGLSSFSLGGEILTSSAAWSSVLFGDPAKTFNKYKIQITTPTSIKQYSQINMAVVVGRPSINQLDYMFVDPDMVLT